MSRVLHFSQQFRDSLKVTGVGPMGRRLGQGSYAAVQEVEWRGTLCAAKVLHEILLNDDTPGGSQKFVADFENECITWSKLSHPHVVQFLGVYFQPGCTIPILLLEKMDTSLRTNLEEHSREECSLSDKIHILRQAVQGLAYLHRSFQPPLVHHDLSPNNILLSRVSNLAKLTDFGMTRIVDPSGGSRKSSMKGTLAFMPPEALVEPLRYDVKLDVFSFGNVIITTLTHAWPNPAAPTKYEGDRLVALSEFERRQQNMIQFTEEESALFLEMVRSCLENRPNLRPTSLQLVDQMKQMEGVHPRKAVVVEPAAVVQINASMKTLQLQPKVFSSNLARRGKQRSEKMPDLLFATHSATPVTIGREVYIAGGVTGDNTTAKLVQVYDIDNRKCRTLPPAPQYLCQAVAIQGNLVLIGGRDSSTREIINLVSTWMTREERWTQTLPPMNVKRSRPGVLLLDSLLFVFGGLSEDKKSLLDTFEVLDLTTKQWMECRGRLPAPMFCTQVGLFRDHVMLVCGGSAVGIGTTACYTVPVQALEDSANNPSSPPIQWTHIQSAPYCRSSLLTTSQDAVLIGGDSKDDQMTRGIHRFSSGSWELIGELYMSQLRNLPTVVADNERSFIVFGGSTCTVSKASSSLESVERISYDM